MKIETREMFLIVTFDAAYLKLAWCDKDEMESQVKKNEKRNRIEGKFDVRC